MSEQLTWGWVRLVAREWRLAPNPSDVLVAAMIASHADDSIGTAWPGSRLLERETRLARSTVLRSIARLERAGLLGVERVQGRTNHYTLLGEWSHHATTSDETEWSRGGRGVVAGWSHDAT